MNVCVFYGVVIAKVMVLISANAPEHDATSAEPYNILMLLPLSSRSHRTLFLTLAETLADRGHKVELLVNHPPKSKHPNVREIYHGLPHFQEDKFEMFSARDHPWEVYELVMEGTPKMTRELYKLPQVMDLYNRRKDFHLVLIDNFYNQMMFPFAHEIPLVMVQASSVDPIQSAIMGNVLNPAYVPNGQVKLPQPMGLWHRAVNSAIHLLAGFIKCHLILPKIQAEISSILPDVPALEKIERNQSLILMNYCASFDFTMPLLPSQIEMGCLHCEPGRPLAEELEDWLVGAGDSGVIYFSLGTVAQGTTLPTQWREIFVKVFARLKQRVVWKYEGEIPGVSSNVLVRKWLPQQDLLAHSQMKLFISHAGMLSTQEAVYHATPVLAIPIFADQPRNAHMLQMAKLGLSIDWEDVSEDYLLDKIKSILESEVYTENMKSASRILKDHPVSPREKAAFWIEYVIRHRGAPHLRSNAATLSWVQYLLLDVVAFYIAVAAVIISCLRWIIVRIIGKILSGTRGKKLKEN